VRVRERSAAKAGSAWPLLMEYGVGEEKTSSGLKGCLRLGGGEGADEAAKRHLIPSRLVAKGVQLRLLWQASGGDDSPNQNAQADVLLRRLHCALPRRRGTDAQDELHSAAQERRKAMRTAALASMEWAARPTSTGCAVPAGWRRRLCAPPCCGYFSANTFEFKSPSGQHTGPQSHGPWATTTPFPEEPPKGLRRDSKPTSRSSDLRVLLTCWYKPLYEHRVQ
jgi:hypothetical protein